MQATYQQTDLAFLMATHLRFSKRTSLDTTDEDRQREFNCTDNLRPIPPGDPDFERLYRRRNDIESINRGVDDSLWLGRAHSKGHLRQTMDLVGYALMVNGLALQLHRKRTEIPIAA